MKPRPWRQWTLRSRMVVSIAALAAVGLLVVSISSVFLLRSYLQNRVDQQLELTTHRPNLGDRVIATGTPGESRRSSLLFGPPAELRLYHPDGTVAGLTFTRDSQTNFGTFRDFVSHADQGPYTVDVSGTAWRVQVATQTTDTGDHLLAAAGVSLHDLDDTQNTLLLLDLGVTLVVLIGIAVVAATVVRLGLRPLTRMETAATEIVAGDLSRRVEDADPHTESGRLGLALNAMLVHIESAMDAKTASEQRLRRFLADAAHELRTPLTSIQGFAELYRRGGAKPGPELDEAMGAIDSEVARMRGLVNDLLVLARLDEERPLVQQSVDLLAVAADTVRDAHVRVPTRFVLLGPLDDTDETFDAVTVTGDEARLRQVTTNLVTNALQHTPEDSQVVVRVGRAVPAQPEAPTASTGVDLAPDVPVAVIEVSDTGPGLPASAAQRVFERLYRADPSRSRRHGGAGLGLSIVSAIVQAHGGRVELWTAPGAGTRFRVLLPASPCREAVEHSEDGADSEVALR